MGRRIEGKTPPWGYAYVPGTCSMCGEERRLVLRADDRTTGICEACAVYSYWAWHALPHDAEPSAPEGKKVERVKVILTRLRDVGGKLASPASASSYDFAMVECPDDGALDLPSTVVQKDEDVSVAVDRILAELDLCTWPPFVERLYTALTPRGRLAAVMLVTAYARKSDDDRLQWRIWPPWKHSPGMAALYGALEDVWELRIAKHMSSDGRPTGITTLVRKAAADYVQMQRNLRAGKKDVDTSMVEVLRKYMSDDEKWVDRRLREYEEGEAELRAEVAERAEDEAPKQLALPAAGEDFGEAPAEADDADDEVQDPGGQDDGFNPEEDAG